MAASFNPKPVTLSLMDNIITFIVTQWSKVVDSSHPNHVAPSLQLRDNHGDTKAVYHRIDDAYCLQDMVLMDGVKLRTLYVDPEKDIAVFMTKEQNHDEMIKA